MRLLTYTNSNGDSIILGSNDYPITSLEGLGNPEVLNQSQKAPFQDGSTWIDSLLTDREIIVNGSINKPKDLTLLNTGKRTMLSILNPKLGIGDLVYTYDGGSVTIKAIPTVTFANKSGMNPFIDYSVNFLCNDPYFKANTSTTIDLNPPLITALDNVFSIEGAHSIPPDVFQLANGDLITVYPRKPAATTLGLYYRIYTGGAWGTEQTINSTNGGGNSTICQLTNGDLVLVYQWWDPAAVSSKFLSYRVYSGGSFGAEVLINSYISGQPRIVSLDSNEAYLVFVKDEGGSVFSLQGNLYTAGAFTTDSEITPNFTGGNLDLIRLANGNLYLGYLETTALYTMQYSTFWSFPNNENVTISSGVTRVFSFSQFDNGNIGLFYKSATGSENFAYRIKVLENDIGWTEEIVIKTTGLNIFSPKAITLSTGNILVMTLENGGGYYTFEFYIDFTIATVTGDYKTPVQITFNGPATKPTIIKNNTNESIIINRAIIAGEVIQIDTTFGKKSIKIVSVDGLITNGMAFLDNSSVFFDLDQGDNEIYFVDTSIDTSSLATATMTWTERYVGI